MTIRTPVGLLRVRGRLLTLSRSGVGTPRRRRPSTSPSFNSSGSTPQLASLRLMPFAFKEPFAGLSHQREANHELKPNRDQRYQGRKLQAINIGGGGRNFWRIPVEAYKAFLDTNHSFRL